MENSEKKYKELVGKIEKAYLYAQTDSTKAVLEDIFPELKDDDEKTRKELIELIGCMHDADPRKKGWIAWLEKLKVFSEHGDGLYYFGDNGFTYVGNPTCDNVSWIEKQGDKPQGKTALEAIKENPVNNANKIEPKFKIEKGKWYVCIKDLLDNYANRAFYKGDEYLRRWLKDIIHKEYDKSTEWSEEDEENVNNILYVFNQLKGASFYKEDDTAEKIIAWLESLKCRVQSQKQWKPSEEQMEALEQVCEIAGSKYKTKVSEIYKQLKKLK